MKNAITAAFLILTATSYVSAGPLAQLKADVSPSVLAAAQDLKVPPPPPPHQQSGQPGHDEHFNPDHGGDHGPGPHPGPGHDHHPLPDYQLVTNDNNCSNWRFTAQTPSVRTEKVIGETEGFDCYWKGSDKYCRPTGEYFTREITVDIGPRKLETWETESLKVCLESQTSPRLDTADMLYEYSVAEENTSSLFKKATKFTLTPGAKKPAKPGLNELTVASAGAGPAGELRLVLSDTRAGYFKGEKIDISIDGMKVPEPNATVEELLHGFVTISAQGSFSVAPAYEFKLLDKAKAGQYVITVKYTRSGPLSNGEASSTTEIFEIK